MNEEIKQYLQNNLSISLAVDDDVLRVKLLLEGQEVSYDYVYLPSLRREHD